METKSLTQQLANSYLQPHSKLYTGYSQIDQITGGLRPGNTYLVAGLEKSGKSSFVTRMVDYWLEREKKVLFLNTELTGVEFVNRMAATHNFLPLSEVEIDLEKCISGFEKELALSWQYSERHKNNLTHFNLESQELLDAKGCLSIKKTLDIIENYASSGVEVVVIDNLTSFSRTDNDRERQWEKLSQAISTIITAAKTYSIICLVVVHTKPSVVWTETPSGIRTLLRDEAPEKIFSESISINRRPSLTDVYGGGSAQSQLSGAFLVWRPYQKFADPDLQALSMVILESFRHSPNGQVEMRFIGEALRFEEEESDKDIINAIKEGYGD